MISKLFKQISTKQSALVTSQFRRASSIIDVQPGFDLTQIALPKQDQELIIDLPWATKPFLAGQPLQLPIFDFATGNFTGKLIDLDQNIYNLPLRRDIIHKVYMYFFNLDRRTYKRALTRGDISGSGLKMRPQKKSGRARQGDKRAPHLKKGGKAHGAVPVDYYYPLNEKIRLLGLKTLLSAKLYEEKIIMIDSEQLDYGKSKYLSEIIAPYKQDKLLFLTPFEADQNFKQAAQNIQNVNVLNPQEFNVAPILKNDWIIATVKGIQELEMVLDNRQSNLFRNRKIHREKMEYDSLIPQNKLYFEKKRDPFEEDIINAILEQEDSEIDKKPLKILSRSLKGYVKDLQKLQGGETASTQKDSQPQEQQQSQ